MTKFCLKWVFQVSAGRSALEMYTSLLFWCSSGFTFPGVRVSSLKGILTARRRVRKFYLLCISQVNAGGTAPNFHFAIVRSGLGRRTSGGIQYVSYVSPRCVAMIFGGIVRGDFQHGVTTFSFFGLPSLGQAKKVKILRFLGQSFLFNNFLSIAQGVRSLEQVMLRQVCCICFT